MHASPPKLVPLRCLSHAFALVCANANTDRSIINLLRFEPDSSISFCCSSQVRCCRYFNGLLLMVVLTTCQACSFVVYGSDFCNTYGCSFSRGSGLAVGAIASYILAGIGFFLSNDYPGDEFVSPVQSDPASEEEDPEFATPSGSNTGFYPNDYSTTNAEEQAMFAN